MPTTPQTILHFKLQLALKLNTGPCIHLQSTFLAPPAGLHFLPPPLDFP